MTPHIEAIAIALRQQFRDGGGGIETDVSMWLRALGEAFRVATDKHGVPMPEAICVRIDLRGDTPDVQIDLPKPDGHTLQ